MRSLFATLAITIVALYSSLELCTAHISPACKKAIIPPYFVVLKLGNPSEQYFLEVAQKSAQNCCSGIDGSGNAMASSGNDQSDDEIPDTCLCPVIAPSSSFPEKFKAKTRKKIKKWCKALKRDCGFANGVIQDGDKNATDA